MGALPSTQPPEPRGDYYSHPTTPKLNLRVPGDWGTRGVLILALFVILVIVIASVVALVVFPPPTPPLPLCWPAQVCPATVLASKGTSIWVEAKGSYGIVSGLELYGPGAPRNYSWVLTGSFVATYSVSFFVMNSTQDQLWVSQGVAGLPPSADWSSGAPAPWGSVNATLVPSSSYYFVWINPGPDNSQVTFTTALSAIPVG